MVSCRTCPQVVLVLLLASVHGLKRFQYGTRVSMQRRVLLADPDLVGKDSASASASNTAPKIFLPDIPLLSSPFIPVPLSPQQVQIAADLKSQEWTARALLLTVSAFYGTNFGCVKILDQALDPSMAAAFRFTLASLVFMPFLLSHISKSSDLIRGGLEVGVYLFFGYWAQAHSLLTSSASTTAFICSLAVIVVPLLDLLSGKKKNADLPWYVPLFPALLAASGVGFLELGGSTVPGVGDLWAIAQPICFGLGFWRAEAHVRQAQAKQPGATQAFTGAMMLTVAAISWVWAIVEFLLPNAHNLAVDGSAMTLSESLGTAFQSQVAQVGDWHVALAILWTGIVTTALTSFGENYAMKSLSSAETTVIFSTEPLWGTAFAAVVLGESVGSNVFVGAALILCACIWSSLGPSVTLSSVTASILSSAPVWLQEGIEPLENSFASIRQNLAELVGMGVQDTLVDEL